MRGHCALGTALGHSGEQGTALYFAKTQSPRRDKVEHNMSSQFSCVCPVTGILGSMGWALGACHEETDLDKASCGLLIGIWRGNVNVKQTR